MTDSDSAGEGRRRPTLKERLPTMLEVRIDRVPFQPPKHEFIKSTLSDVSEVIAFDLRFDGPLPVEMNATPVLFVGDVALTDAEVIKDGYVRFYAYPAQWEELKAEASIAIGWPGRGPESRVPSKFRYEPPSEN